SICAKTVPPPARDVRVRPNQMTATVASHGGFKRNLRPFIGEWGSGLITKANKTPVNTSEAYTGSWTGDDPNY
ncbi:hypothetical protein KAU45_04720, partial [bacterium]|nr:hypothetical protein [bacterium]